MPSSLGPAEILVILLVGLIVLGPQKLPEAGRQVGRALAEIRRWSRDVQSEVKGAFDDDAWRPTFETSATPQPEPERAATPADPSPPAEAAGEPEGGGAGDPEPVPGEPATGEPATGEPATGEPATGSASPAGAAPADERPA